VTIAFYPVTRFFFAQDDFGWLRLARYRWTDAGSVLTDYHGSFTPVANLLLASGLRLFGLAPGPFHAANLVFHLAASVLVALLAQRVTGRRDAAFAAAAFFATTFSHWEAVMWLAGGMPQVVATLFLLAAVLMAARWAEGGGSGFPFTAFVLSLLAILTKETGVVAPLLLAVYLAFGRDRVETPGARLPWRAWAVALAPWAVAWPVYLFFQAYGFNFSRLVAGGMYKASLGGHVVSNALRYTLCLVLPDASSPYTAPHLQALSPRLYSGLVSGESAAVVALPFALAWLLWRGGRIARFTVLWVAASLVPFVFLTGPLAARYLYLASAGFAVGVGWLFSRPTGLRARRASWALLSLIVLANLFANRLAERTRVANGAVRREIVTMVAAAANGTTGPLAVYLAGVPDKYEDVVEGIIAWTRESVSPTRVADEAALPPTAVGTMSFVYRDGRLERGP
jgi:hypothetical protein